MEKAMKVCEERRKREEKCVTGLAAMWVEGESIWFELVYLID
jgi:hypothetical protein